MRRILILGALALLVMPCPGWAQTETKEQPVHYLSHRDTLLLTVVDGKKIIYHTIKPKQTLFSLAKFYSLTLEELYDLNPVFRTDPVLHTGDRVKISVPNKAIRRYKGNKFVTWKSTPIFYVVQNGDNLFQICKRYFGMPVDSIVQRNRLKDHNIHPGQLLHMGWMNTDGIPPDWRPQRAVTPSDVLRGQFDQEKERRKEVVSQGVCFWQKDSKEDSDLYALHREAVIGSVIAVTNPMGPRTVFAKVIGRIPEGYERNIECILSPGAARKIGARDPRFFVKVRYLK
jgi:LysM repeat protein